MGRKPDGLTARTEHVTARFTMSTAAALDRMRGEMKRSPFLEKLVKEEARRREGEKK